MSKDVVSLSTVMSKNPQIQKFQVWIVGDTPLVVHAWSHKAKAEMLQKQVKSTRGGKEQRDPEADFKDSLYPMGKDAYGFPATGIKNCILSAAHKDKGVPRTQAMQALWIDAEMVRAMPALAGAICDVPLIRIHGSPPEMREDMVRIGAGVQKTANLAYRGQFTVWAMRVTGELNTTVVTMDQLAFLLREAGKGFGIGEWRNERKGMFGAFHIADAAEDALWEDFAAGKGPLPVPASYTGYEEAEE